MKEIERKAVEFLADGRKKEKILANYDKVEDVLYINFLKSPPQEADYGHRVRDYIVRMKGREVVGVTILNAREHSLKNFSDIPEIVLDKTKHS
jgi:uncharacterized protein YuzE